MERQLFTNQMIRLTETYGERAYPKERMQLLWHSFKDISDFVFTDAVSELIVTQRSMPMFKEFDAAIETARQRENEARQSQNASYLSIMEDAAKKTPNKELAKACIDAVKWKIDTNPTEDKWLEVLAHIQRIVDLGGTKKQCQKCEGTGLVFKTEIKMGNEYDFVYRCHCVDGLRQNLLRDVPMENKGDTNGTR